MKNHFANLVRPGFLVCGLVLFISSPVLAQVSFTESSNSLLTTTNYYSGVAIGIADMNGDGKDDIVHLDDAREVNIEYQNAPNQQFSHFTFGNLTGGSAWALTIADVDHNGYNDILAGGAYNDIKLLKANSAGTNYTQSSLPNSNIFLQGVNFADIDNDGWVDVFACHDDDDNHAFRNDQSGTFVYDSNLINTSMPSGNSGNYGSVWTDYDNDGDLDMYLSKCRGGVNSSSDPRRINRLFQNDGNNGFTEVGQAAGLRIGAQSWASDFGDIDNDGDMDCFIVNHFEDCQLMRNNGDGTFTDISSGSGVVEGYSGLFGIQCKFADFDNDGFVDILISGDEHRLFYNDGDSTFTEASNPFNNDEMESFAVGDLNSDGFVDIYAGYANFFNSPSNIRDDIFINDGNSNNHLTVRLDGVTSNKNGIGARLELHGSWGMQIREMRSGESYGIMNSLNRYFGIGTATSIDKLVIRWPNGTVDEVLNPAINTAVAITEGDFPPVTEYAPDSANLVLGTPVSGSVGDVADSDDTYLKYSPFGRYKYTDSPVTVDFDTQLESDSPSSLEVTFEGSVDKTNIQQVIEAYNWNTSQYVSISVQNASVNTDSTVTVDLTSSISDYVESGTGNVRIRTRWRDNSRAGGNFWQVCIDQMVLTAG